VLSTVVLFEPDSRAGAYFANQFAAPVFKQPLEGCRGVARANATNTRHAKLFNLALPSNTIS
jgi:hypothetical protein